MDNNELLIRELTKLSKETEWLEFKQNVKNPDEIGEYISALSNSATYNDKNQAYLVWGVEDVTHQIVGTSFHPSTEKIGNEELENWLHHLLSRNASFSFSEFEIEGKRIVLFTIQKAVYAPVTFKNIAYIRVGSYKKRLQDYTAVEVQLQNKLTHSKYEEILAKQDLDKTTVLKLLDYVAYFDMTNIPLSTEGEQILRYLIEDLLVVKQDNGLFAITNVGALMYAKKLSDFPTLARKMVRIIQYNGNSRVSTKNDLLLDKGYACGFEEMMRYIDGILPKKETITDGVRSSVPSYPSVSVRELIANALIHQDLVPTGVGPTIEIFDKRLEITNPGTPLVDIARIIDNPPKSRNEIMAALMRRVGICEEQGSGWDKVVYYCEHSFLPAPKIEIFQNSTKVTLFVMIPFSKMTREDRIRSCYLHACLKQVNGEQMNNTSLRTRFGLPANANSTISRLINETVKEGCIKPVDPDTAPRYMKYLPFWA